MPEGAVYVGRGSRWGNPYRVEQDKPSGHWFCHGPGISPLTHPCGNEEGARLEAVNRFRTHAKRTGLNCEELRGKTLACWCRESQPCHADVLLKMANG